MDAPIPIESLSDFVSEVSKMQHLDNSDTLPFWYRGHAKNEFELKPGALRKSFVGNDHNEWIELERIQLEAFRREGASLLPSGDEVNWYFLAQHHGLPTRLLDWSMKPLVALFFAVAEFLKDDGEVIALLPDDRIHGSDEANATEKPFFPVTQRHKLVKKTIRFLFGRKENPPSQPIIVPLRPDLTFSRMLQQGSCFTLHMPGASGITGTFSTLKRFRITAASKPRILTALRAIGIGWETIYPDLDNLCREIRERENFVT